MKKKNEDQIRLQFNESPDQRLEYEDMLPEDVEEEDLLHAFGKLVWCEYKECFWNKQFNDLQRTWGTIQKNPNFDPIAPSEMVWNGICSRPNEIVLRYKSVRDTSGGRTHVPYCYTVANNGKTGHRDFSALLQSDGTPYGGNIDSQHGEDHSFPLPQKWGNRERIVKYGTSPERPHKSHTIGE